jgi:hypothetical protein
MTKKTNPEPEEKTFSLKDIELQMVQNMHNRANQSLFDFFSFIALERLAYTVTEHTRFRVEDGKMFISEVEPPEANGEPANDGVSVA